MLATPGKAKDCKNLPIPSLLSPSLALALTVCGLFFSLSYTSSSTAQEATRLLRNEIAQLDNNLEESSGLAWHDGFLWTHNDSGDEARFFKLDLAGTIVQEYTLIGAENVDWESMAHDEHYLYVADTGNNANTRSTFIIYRISWSALTENEEIEAERIEIHYSDYQAGNRSSHNFDAEGLAVREDELWLFSKNRGDRQSKIYRFPKLPGSYTVEPSQTLSVDGLVTAADIHPGTGQLVLFVSQGRGRGTVLWSAATSDDGVDNTSATVIEISPTDQWEALVFDPTMAERLYLSHENNRQGYAGLAWVLLE